MEYTLPKLKDLRVDKLYFFDMLVRMKSIDYLKIHEIVKLNSEFTGLEENFLLTVTKESNYDLANEINNLVMQYTPSVLKKSYTFNGKKYNLSIDLGKMPTAFWVDTSNQDMEKNPIRMASSIYIEDGMDYSELDKHNNIINPVSERDKIFKEHLPLTDYLDIQGFFLQRYNELTPLYMEAKQQATVKTLKIDFNGMK